MSPWTSKAATLTCDAENRIATVSGDTYTYDGNGLRVKKSGTSASRLYWPGLDGKTLNETDLSGGNVVRNVYFNGALVARVDAAGAVHHLVHDHLGSTRVVLGATGAVQDQIDYYPFGKVLDYSLQSSGNPYTFTGYESDPESSSYHAWFRNQSPSLGRFLSSDPYDGSYDVSNPQSLNRYAYVQNNPAAGVDPYGLQSQVLRDVNDLPPDAYWDVFDLFQIPVMMEGSVWVPGHEVPYEPYVPGQWQYQFSQVGTGNPLTNLLFFSPHGAGPVGGGGGAANTPDPKSWFYYKVTCPKRISNSEYSKRGCTYLCGGEEEWGPFLEYKTGGFMHFTQKQLTPACGPLSEIFCPTSLTVEGNYEPISGWTSDPFISNCKM